MPKRKVASYEDTLKILREEIDSLDKWDRLYKSEHGQFLVKQIDQAIQETLNAEDKTDIYKMDQNAREYFFSSVRSKRQTLNAIKEKLLNAEKEKAWRVQEASKLMPRE